MTGFLGVTWPVFFGVTVVLFGAAAFKTGQAVAATWRPLWHVLPYCLLLAVADRFFSYFLFSGVLLSLGGFLASVLVLSGFGLAAYQLTRAQKMTAQYPWMFERHGVFGWREKR
jgi:hypothetical protein